MSGIIAVRFAQRDRAIRISSNMVGAKLTTTVSSYA